MKGINPDTGKPTQRYDFTHDRKQRKLQDSADKILARAGFFKSKREEFDGIEADSIGINGNLRPTWQGRP